MSSTTPIGQLDDSTRKSLLGHAVMEHVRAGGRVEVQADFNAVIRYPAGKKPLSVWIHLLLTFITGFLWIPVWILLARRRRPAAMGLMVDAHGRVHSEPLREFR